VLSQVIVKRGLAQAVMKDWTTLLPNLYRVLFARILDHVVPSISFDVVCVNCEVTADE
jgi:hypothetical protein